MEKGNRIVGDDMAGAIDFDGIVIPQFVRAIDAGHAGGGIVRQAELAVPADQKVARLGTADKDIVGNVKVARPGIFGPHAEADAFEARILDRQSDRPDHLFHAREDRDVGVAEGDAIENMMDEKEEKKEENDKRHTRFEYNFSSFSRSFTLPEMVVADKIDAVYDNGELKVMLPKKEEAKKALLSKHVPVK